MSYNALIGQGKSLGYTDDNIANGMKADECALQICKAIYLGHQEFVCTTSMVHRVAINLLPFLPDFIEAKLG